MREKPWRRHYKELKDYFEKHGNSRVPYRYKENPSLGRWVQKQRSNPDKLTKKQLDLLNKLNFEWSKDVRKDKHKNWLLMYKRLEKFKEQKGHCNVPSKYEADKKLGRWVEVLRLNKEKLEDWKLQKLEQVGFKWSAQIQKEKAQNWYDMYRRLELFFEQYGHSNVPEYWKEDPKLSMWVIAQRRPKKPLPMQKKKLLDLLEFSWNKEIPAQKKRRRDAKGRFVKEV